MANWVGVSRTNYFVVKDPDSFVEDMAMFHVEVISRDDGRFALIAATDDGGWNSVDWRKGPDACEDEANDCWFPEIVAEYLADGEVAVLQTIGAEKMRYLSGYAVAIRNDKKYVQVSIDDIYKLAEKELGVEEITLATY
jgi:hypothetical protein